MLGNVSRLTQSNDVILYAYIGNAPTAFTTDGNPHTGSKDVVPNSYIGSFQNNGFIFFVRVDVFMKEGLTIMRRRKSTNTCFDSYIVIAVAHIVMCSTSTC